MYVNVLTKYITEYNNNNYSISDISEKPYLTYDFIVPKKNLKNVHVKIIDLKCKLLSLHWLNYLYQELDNYENIFTNDYLELEGEDIYKQKIVMLLLENLLLEAAEKVEVEEPINMMKVNKTFKSLKEYQPFNLMFESNVENIKKIITVINNRILFNQRYRERYIDIAQKELVKQAQLKEDDPEWLYVISPGEYHYGDIYKIGMTTRSPSKRVSELNNTSTYNSFFIHTFLPTSDAASYEKNMHKKLSMYRINERREFFRLNILNVINSLLDDFDLFDFYFFV